MIYYFSATGNCKHVAKTIAKAIGDRAESIEEANPHLELEKDEVLGFVTPTYFWKLPLIVSEFMSNAEITLNGENYTFLISTFGTTPGCSAEEARRILAINGVLLDASYSIRMPDNWTVWFDLSNPEKVNAQNAKADLAIQKVTERIRKRDLGNHQKRRAPYFVKAFTTPAFDDARRTSNLHLEETCIGCGICAKNCPASAIEMKDGKPVWVKDHCELCFRCLHHCPKFAIQYGNGATKKHGQYVHPEKE
ncbi:MAG: EFR1 family ferrodoxin [Lachnospiraceae bacterium]|nr:EFR1 family ferrodoxin [Lachnospiraceae bacterium]